MLTSSLSYQEAVLREARAHNPFEVAHARREQAVKAQAQPPSAGSAPATRRTGSPPSRSGTLTCRKVHVTATHYYCNH